MCRISTSRLCDWYLRKKFFYLLLSPILSLRFSETTIFKIISKFGLQQPLNNFDKRFPIWWEPLILWQRSSQQQSNRINQTLRYKQIAFILSKTVKFTWKDLAHKTHIWLIARFLFLLNCNISFKHLLAVAQQYKNS